MFGVLFSYFYLDCQLEGLWDFCSQIILKTTTALTKQLPFKNEKRKLQQFTLQCSHFDGAISCLLGQGKTPRMACLMEGCRHGSILTTFYDYGICVFHTHLETCFWTFFFLNFSVKTCTVSSSHSPYGKLHFYMWLSRAIVTKISGKETKHESVL